MDRWISCVNSESLKAPGTVLSCCFTAISYLLMSYSAMALPRTHPSTNSYDAVLDSGVTIGRARRAVHAGPALWGGGPKFARRCFFKVFLGKRGPFWNTCTRAHCNLVTPLVLDPYLSREGTNRYPFSISIDAFGVSALFFFRLRHRKCMKLQP